MLDRKAGTHCKEGTKLKELHGSERVVFKSAGGTIIIDGGGITLKGNVTIKGNVAISGGSGGGAKTANLRANKGTQICIPCFLEKMKGK
jgi:type VI secretion system secreted protein VgrG